jgi:6-pyruvoyl-tetrahydropterin synthase
MLHRSQVKNVVITMDNTSHLLSMALTTSSRECEIIKWLQKNNVCNDPSHTRKGLLTFVGMVKLVNKCYELSEIASSRGHSNSSPTLCVLIIQYRLFVPSLNVKLPKKIKLLSWSTLSNSAHYISHVKQTHDEDFAKKIARVKVMDKTIITLWDE